MSCCSDRHQDAIDPLDRMCREVVRECECPVGKVSCRAVDVLDTVLGMSNLSTKIMLWINHSGSQPHTASLEKKLNISPDSSRSVLIDLIRG
jgi:hypothetical protein